MPLIIRKDHSGPLGPDFYYTKFSYFLIRAENFINARLMKHILYVDINLKKFAINWYTCTQSSLQYLLSFCYPKILNTYHKHWLTKISEPPKSLHLCGITKPFIAVRCSNDEARRILWQWFKPAKSRYREELWRNCKQTNYPDIVPDIWVDRSSESYDVSEQDLEGNVAISLNFQFARRTPTSNRSIRIRRVVPISFLSSQNGATHSQGPPWRARR